MLQLDLRSRVPIYEQLTQKLKELIVHKVLRDDEQLPSVRELAQELTINPNTIQKAYRELEQQGYIYSLQGKGNFVMPAVKMETGKRKAELIEQLNKVVEELLYLGVSSEEIIKTLDVKGDGE